MNYETDEVLGIVHRDYRLVTNIDACNYARACAREVFPDTVPDEWEIFAVDAPGSASYCHVDLRHKTGKLDFDYVMVGTREEVPDFYGPFVRVTNSYNGQRALKFTIGCYRKVCMNGLTAPGDVVSFSFAHTSDDIGLAPRFFVDHARVRSMKREFKKAFDDLRQCRVPREHGKELVKVILAIRMPKNAEKKGPSKLNAVLRDWYRLDGHVESLYSKYADQLGDHAYSALQAATDLASGTLKNLCLRKSRHALQLLAGEWMIDFKGKCRQPDFKLTEYLKCRAQEHDAHAA